MSRFILLDASPLGRLCRPNGRSPLNREILQWFEDAVNDGSRIAIPEITDFEVRRELIRADLRDSIIRLNSLKQQLRFVPLDSDIMLRAAELWAISRNQGLPTADPRELDCDVILAAQAEKIGAVVATENVGHISRFVSAKHWRDLP
jgi:predicted nucleic acid-binding protein